VVVLRCEGGAIRGLEKDEAVASSGVTARKSSRFYPEYLRRFRVADMTSSKLRVRCMCKVTTSMYIPYDVICSKSSVCIHPRRARDTYGGNLKAKSKSES
jgi:hypothetical protein